MWFHPSSSCHQSRQLLCGFHPGAAPACACSHHQLTPGNTTSHWRAGQQTAALRILCHNPTSVWLNPPCSSPCLMVSQRSCQAGHQQHQPRVHHGSPRQRSIATSTAAPTAGTHAGTGKAATRCTQTTTGGRQCTLQRAAMRRMRTHLRNPKP